jgi:hypothetical protein
MSKTESKLYEDSGEDSMAYYDETGTIDENKM